MKIILSAALSGLFLCWNHPYRRLQIETMLNLDGEELEQGLIYGRTGINVAQGAYLGITRTLHAKEKILL